MTHKTNELPILEQIRESRPACPFYGLKGMFGVFLDSKGNQCGLEDGYRPCQMEMANVTPNWNECPFNKEENKSHLTRISEMKVFPDELSPGNGPWDGISMKDWTKYIMTRH